MMYFSGLTGILVIEQRIYNKITPNGTTKFQKWWSDRKDDVIVEIPLTIILIYYMNDIWYLVGLPFVWSNGLTAVAAALIAVPTAWFFMDLLPDIFIIVKNYVLNYIKKLKKNGTD